MDGKMDGKQEKKFHEMTETPVSRLICRLALPCIISMLVTSFYNMADTFFVGMLKSNSATGAVGVVFSMMAIIQAVGFFFGHGSGNFISRELGKQNFEEASNMAAIGFFSALAAGTAICVLGQLFLEPLAMLLGSTATILPYTKAYLRVILFGAPWMTASLVLNNQLRYQGSAAYAMVGIASGAVLNIGLDPLLIFNFGLGVAGAAWATIISQLISGAMCMVRLLRMKEHFTVTLRTLWPKKEFVMRLCKLGLPSGLTQAIFSLAMIIVQNLTNSFGTAVLAANTVVMRVDGFAMMPNFTFGSAMTTYTGQNMGAGRLDRTEKGAKSGMIMGVSVSVVLVGLILVFGKYLMLMFTDTHEVIELGQRMLNTLALGYIAMSVTQILSGVMRGAGDTMTPMWISVVTTVIVRVPVAYGLEFLTRPEGGAMGSGNPDPLFLSLLISWVVGALLTTAAYLRGSWKKKAITEKAGQE